MDVDSVVGSGWMQANSELDWRHRSEDIDFFFEIDRLMVRVEKEVFEICFAIQGSNSKAVLDKC